MLFALILIVAGVITKFGLLIVLGVLLFVVSGWAMLNGKTGE